MGSFSLVHWIVLAVLLLLLFGGNRFSAMMGDVAKGLKSFKKGMAEDDDKPSPRADPRQLPPNQQPPIDVTPKPRPAEPTTTSPPSSDDSAR